MKHLKQLSITLIGGIFLLIGLVFFILPGPAIIFIPLGLIILAKEYPIAKDWLKRYQRYSRKAAVQLDLWVSQIRYKLKKR